MMVLEKKHLWKCEKFTTTTTQKDNNKDDRQRTNFNEKRSLDVFEKMTQEGKNDK